LALTESFGFGIPYSDEFNKSGVNDALLRRLATVTNGRMLRLEEDPSDLFSAHAELKSPGRHLWPHFALAALLLLVLDVGTRKFLSLRRNA
jgi:hypothetical protein